MVTDKKIHDDDKEIKTSDREDSGNSEEEKESSGSEESSESEGENEETTIKKENSENEDVENEEEEDKVDDEESKEDVPKTTKKKKKDHRLDISKVDNFNEKLRRRGVLYIARIPPRMNPSKIKSLLSDFGNVIRIYLVEEDPTVRKNRKMNSTSRRAGAKRYTEGWVEFESKKVAKRLGATLNNTPITNNKRSPNYGDLWNVRYLKGFKWSHLTEKVAYERRVREHKLRIEMMQAKKEHSEYKSLVERGKVMDYIEERRNKRKSSGTGDNEKEKNNNKKKKHFRQNMPLDESSAKVKPVKSAVLSSLVG